MDSALLLVLAGSSGPGAPAPIVQDTFTDANGTLISAHTPEVAPGGSAWATIAGTEWQIQGNRVRGSGGNETRTIINSGETAVDVQADVVLDGTNQGSGIVYRTADADNAILDYLYDLGDLAMIYKEVANAWTLLASVAYTVGAGTHTVRGTVNASHNHTMYVGGVQQLTATDSALATNTQIGCHEGNLGLPEWDNFDCYLFGDRP